MGAVSPEDAARALMADRLKTPPSVEEAELANRPLAYTLGAAVTFITKGGACHEAGDGLVDRWAGQGSNLRPWD